MPKYTIHYFDARGRAELSRLILAYSKIEFEDRRISREEWPEVKDTFPSGQIPVLTLEDGTMLNESLAIARYLAREHGIAGKNNIEAALADAIVDGLMDMFKDMIKVIHGTEEEKQATIEAFQTSIPKALAIFEKGFEKNGTDYLVGDGLTWVDIAMAMALDELTNMKIGDNLFNECPKLVAHHERIFNIPQIKTYVENRKESPF